VQWYVDPTNDPEKWGEMYRARLEKEAAAKKNFPCPCPEFVTACHIESVATRYFGGQYLEAEELLNRSPAKFNQLQGWDKVIKAAQAIADERNLEKAKKAK
jgi:hypothetical protein